MNEKLRDQFTPLEVQKRFETALRGARIAGAQHKESVTPKKRKAKRKNRDRKKD